MSTIYKIKRGHILFTRFKKEHKRLFLDPSSNEKFEHSTGEKVEVVLSPALYWVKKLKLPVKNAREAKKLLPSIFEDLLPLGHYAYHAYKSGDEFLLFAYEERKILELLQKVGVAFAEIAGVHFAQSLSAFVETPKSINEKQALLLKDDVVILVPLVWVETHSALKIEKIKLSSNSIKLQQFGHLVDNSSLVKIGIVLAFLALLLSMEIFIASAKKEQVSLAKEEIFSHYKLQSTLMQNRSSLEKYTKINAEQKKLRVYIGAFLSLKLEQGQKITNMSYKNKKFSCSINKATPKSVAAIKKQLSVKGIVAQETLSKENLKLEVVL